MASANTSQQATSVKKFTFPSTLFQLEQFEAYDETEFIESLTYRLLNEASKCNDSTQADYCKTFDELFTKSVEELEKLMETVNKRIGDLVESTEQHTQNHHEAMNNLNTELENVSETFKILEETINKVGNTTVQIGNTLENVDKQKKRAMEAKKLMEYFEEFNKYDSEQFANTILMKRKMKHTVFHNKAHIHVAARIVQQLSSIAKDLNRVKHCENAVANIEYYQKIQSKVLIHDFLEATESLTKNRKLALQQMKTAAKILFDIRENQRCMDSFVDNRFVKFLQIKYIPEPNTHSVIYFEANHRDDSDSDSDSDDSDDDSKKSKSDSDSDSDSDTDTEKKSDAKKQKKKKADTESTNSDDDSSDSDDSDKSSTDDKKKKKKKKASSDSDESGSDEDSDDKDSENDTETDEKPAASKDKPKEKPKETKEVEPAKVEVKKEEIEQAPEDNISAEEKEQKRVQQNNEEIRKAQQQLKNSVKTTKDFEVLLSKIEKTLRDEYIVVEQVFPTVAKDVMAKLLGKLLDQVVKIVVDQLLVDAASNGELYNVLITFESIYSECQSFSERLVQKADKSSTSELPIQEQVVMGFLDPIFQKNKENYAAFETKFLDEVYQMTMVAVKDDETRKLERLAEKQSTKKGYFSGLFSSQATLAALLNAATLNTLGDGNTPRKESFDELPELSLITIIQLLHQNTESVVRCKKLSGKKDLPANVFEIFKILLRHVEEYVDRGLDYALSTLTEIKRERPPLPYFFRCLQLANSILQNVQRHLEQFIYPVVSADLTIQANCIAEKDRVFAKLEIKVVHGLELILKAILDHIDFILETEQKKADYKPKENPLLNIYVDNNATIACTKVCNFLNRVTHMIMESLYGGNREFFLSEMGLQFYDRLTRSLKGYHVSPTGAIRFMRDLSEYQRVTRKFEVQVVEDKFDFLRELASIYLVAPQNLENVLSQLDKTKISKEDLLSLVKMRTDYKSDLYKRNLLSNWDTPQQ